MSGNDPLPVDTGRGINILYRNRNLYNPGNPRESALRKAETLALQRDTLYIIASPLLFYGMERLRQRLPTGSTIVCLERDERLMALSVDAVPACCRDLPYFRCADPDLFIGNLSRIMELNFRHCRVLSLNGGCGLYRAFYSSVESRMMEIIQEYWRNRMTVIHMGRRWIRNIIANLGRIALDADDHQILLNTSGMIPGNKAVVVAGAGESLEEQIPLLRRYRKKIYLVAADTALPVLGKQGLMPDLVVVLEAQIYNVYDFMEYSGIEIPILCDLTSHPAVPRCLKGARCFFLSSYSQAAFFDRMTHAGLQFERIPPLGSVGIAAVYFALQNSHRSIFLTGLDFAYRRGKTHANGAPVHSLYLNNGNRLTGNMFYAASLRHPLTLIDGAFHTDPVLSGYGDILKTMLAPYQGIYRLGTTGYPLGIPGITSEDQFRELLQTERKPFRADPEDRASGMAGIQGKIRSFIDQEMDILDQGMAEIQRCLKDEACIPDLKPHAHLFSHFPDYGGTSQRITSNQAMRIYAEMQRLNDLLRNVRQMLSEND